MGGGFLFTSGLPICTLKIYRGRCFSSHHLNLDPANVIDPQVDLVETQVDLSKLELLRMGDPIIQNGWFSMGKRMVLGYPILRFHPQSVPLWI